MFTRIINDFKFSLKLFSGKKTHLAFWILVRALNQALTPLLVPITINVMIDCFEKKGNIVIVVIELSVAIIICLLLSYFIYTYSDAWMIKTMYEFQKTCLIETFKIIPYKRRNAYIDGETFCIINNGAWGLIQIWMKIFRLTGPLLAVLILMFFSVNYSVLFSLLITLSIIIDFVIINFQTKKKFKYREDSLSANGVHETTLKYMLNNVEFLMMNNLAPRFILKNQVSRAKYWTIERKIQLFDTGLASLAEFLNAGYQCTSYLLMQYGIKNDYISAGQLGASDSVTQNARNEAQTLRGQLVSMPDILVPVEKVHELLSLQEHKEITVDVVNDNSDIVEFQNVEVRVGEKLILCGINFKVSSGEKIAIVGKNGAGKSTILKAMVNLVPVTAGKILFLGKESISCNNDLKSFCSYVPAQQILFSQSVKNNVAMGSRDEASSVQIKQTLRDSSLYVDDEFLKKSATVLSGGEAQRVSIARSMLEEHELFLWDEPTSALDQKNAENVMNNIKNSKHTILFTTHKPVELKYSTRVIFIENGAIRCDMPTTKFIDTVYYNDWLGDIL